MKVYELAKILGVKSRELINKIDEVDHHADKVPDEVLCKYLPDEPAEEVVLAPIVEPVVETQTVSTSIKVKETCPVDMATLELSIRCVGNKSPYWKYKALLEG